MRAKFSGEAKFKRATFSGQANFTHTTFSRQAYFHGAKFSRLANFNLAIFSGQANFHYAEFLCSSIAFFRHAAFSGEADFRSTKFSGEAIFSYAKFLNNAYFEVKFESITYFNYVIFGEPNQVIFKVEDMSKVSFINTDTTGIRFSDNTRWRSEKGRWPWSKVTHFRVIEEDWFKEDIGKPIEGNSGKSIEIRERPTMEGVLSVYRNLRENYELRRRYDEAGKFFIREMELKRKYREVISTSITPEYKEETSYKIKKNCWFRRNFSLTGIYHNLSNYGESLWRPTIAGIVIVLIAAFFFVSQSNPTLAPSFSFNTITIKTNNNGHTLLSNVPITTSRFIGLAQIGNGTHWLKAGERGLADFLPLLSLGGDIKVGLIDYIIKIVGGAVTFGLIAIALRRRFERKYTH